MKSWLTYICLFAGCIMALSSCQAEEDLGASTGDTSVELTLSYSSGGPMSRDVAPSDDDNLDYTTEKQAELDINDIFVLAFKVDGTALTLLDWVRNLELVEKSNYYTYKIKGIMPQYSAETKVRFVVLTNLIQNKITGLDTRANVINFLVANKGESSTDIYEKLIYNYIAQTDGNWNVASRRIPMWGEVSGDIQLNQPTIEKSCNLYRAVAKVQIWVNNKQGIAGSDDTATDDDFIIKSITVKNANAQGYCVSKETPNPSINIQYTAASVPATVTKQSDIIYTPTDGNVTYEIDGGNSVTLNDARQAYSDFIYLPEQINIGSNTPVTIDVVYSYNKVEYTGTINFKENGTGAAFDVIRNHSYVFNINKVEEVTGVIYYVVDEWESETVDIPFK